MEGAKLPREASRSSKAARGSYISDSSESDTSISPNNESKSTSKKPSEKDIKSSKSKEKKAKPSKAKKKSKKEKKSESDDDISSASEAESDSSSSDEKSKKSSKPKKQSKSASKSPTKTTSSKSATKDTKNDASKKPADKPKTSPWAIENYNIFGKKLPPPEADPQAIRDFILFWFHPIKKTDHVSLEDADEAKLGATKAAGSLKLEVLDDGAETGDVVKPASAFKLEVVEDGVKKFDVVRPVASLKLEFSEDGNKKADGDKDKKRGPTLGDLLARVDLYGTHIRTMTEASLEWYLRRCGFDELAAKGLAGDIKEAIRVGEWEVSLCCYFSLFHYFKVIKY